MHQNKVLHKMWTNYQYIVIKFFDPLYMSCNNISYSLTTFHILHNHQFKNLLQNILSDRKLIEQSNNLALKKDTNVKLSFLQI